MESSKSNLSSQDKMTLATGPGQIHPALIQGGVVHAAGRGLLSASSLLASSSPGLLHRLRSSPSLSRLRSLGKKPSKSPLPPGVITDGHASEYFLGGPLPPPTPRELISLSTPPNPQATSFVALGPPPPPQTTLSAMADLPSTIRGDEAGRYAYSAMRGEKYNSRGPLYDSMAYVDNKPEEKHDHLRLDEHGPGDTSRILENTAHYDGVPDTPVIRPGRKPRTQDSLYQLAGYNKIGGQFVDPDAIEDVYLAAEGLPTKQKMGLRSKDQARFLKDGVDDKQDSMDSYISVHHVKITVDGPVFTELAQGAQKVHERSKSFVEQHTMGEIGDFELVEGPKSPGKRLAQEDHRYEPPGNEIGSDGWLSAYTPDQNPSPKPKGEGQNLAKVPFMLARNQGRPLTRPAPLDNTTSSQKTFDTDEISELELPRGYFQDQQDLGRGRSLQRDSSPKRAKSLKRVHKIGPQIEGGGSSLRDEYYAGSARSLTITRYNTPTIVDIKRGRPERRIPSPVPPKSLRRVDKHDPHIQRSREDLREQFGSRSPSRGRSRYCLRGKEPKTAQPRLARPESRVRIISKGGNMYNPGVEQPSVASDSSKETYSQMVREASQSFEENIMQQGEEHSTTLESDTMNETLEDEDPAIRTAASIEANFRQGEAQYKALKTSQDMIMDQMNDLKSSIGSTINSLQPAERLALKLTETAAFRASEVALRQYRPALGNAANLWRRELIRMNTQLGGNMAALEDHRAIAQQRIVEMDDKLRKADDMVDDADAKYYQLREELAEIQREALGTMGETSTTGSQATQNNSPSGADQGSLLSQETEQVLSSIGASINLQSVFGAQPQPCVGQQPPYNTAQFEQNAYSVENHGLHVRETSQPRDYRTQPNFVPQQQRRVLSTFQNEAANQERIREFEAAANAPGGLFSASPNSGFPRSYSFGGSQRHASYQLHNQYAANPQRGYNAQVNAQQQQFNAFGGGGQYNMASQPTYGSGQFAGNAPRQPNAQSSGGQQQFDSFGDSRQSVGIQARGNNQAPFGINPQQAQQYAAQLQHDNFGRDVRGEQGARYQYNDASTQMAVDPFMGHEGPPQNPYSSPIRRSDSNLSEAEVRRMSSTGEYIVQPRRGQPNMAPPPARRPLDRIEEEETENYGVQGQVKYPHLFSPASTMRSSPPPRTEQPRYRSGLPPRIRNERGQATIGCDPITADGLIPLRLVQGHLSSPRPRTPKPPQPIRWAWQLPHNGEYRMPGYENMITGMALRGQQNNPHRSNVYRPNGSCESDTVIGAQLRQGMQLQMSVQHQMRYTQGQQAHSQQTGQAWADPEEDDREVFYTAREHPPAPRTPQHQRARSSMQYRNDGQNEEQGSEERGW